MDIKSKKIIFVFEGSELGGAERQGLLLAKLLKEEHHADVQILGLGADRPGRVAQLCEEYGIPWHGVPFSWPDSRLCRLKELVGFASRLRREKPNIILPYTWLPNVVCGLVWKFTGARLCIWNQRDMGIGLNTGFWHRTAVRLTPRFIANSAGGKEVLIDLYRIASDAIEVIHNGVSLAGPIDDRQTWRQRLGVGDNCFIACMVGNLHENKDHLTLLKAWRMVLDRTEDEPNMPVLLLAGRFDGRVSELKELAFDLGLCKRVRFLGKVDDIAGLLHASDLCVHSSMAEGLPNAVLEAMAAGLPVVGTDIPGIREAVGQAGFSFLTPSGDYEILAEKILAMFQDKKLRNEIGKGNSMRISHDFNVEQMLYKVSALLSQCRYC